MGFLDKAEETIESAVNSLFAKFSKAQLQPVEVSQAIRSAMDLAAKKDPIGTTVVPHKYLLLINASDADKITPAMLAAMLLMVAAFWCYGIAVALRRARCIVLERHGSAAWLRRRTK